MVPFKPRDEYESQIWALVQEHLLSPDPAKFLIASHRNPKTSLPYATQPETIAEIIELPENTSNITITGTLMDLRPTKPYTRKDGSGSGCRQQFRLDDSTASIRVVAWGKSCTDPIFHQIEVAAYERGKVEIRRGVFKINIFQGVQYNELHLSSYNYSSIVPVFDD